MKRSLLTNLRILDPSSDVVLRENACITIEDGAVVSIDDHPPANGTFDERIDFSGKVVLPGMINAHTHLYSALALGMPGPKVKPFNFVQILERVWWKLDRALDEKSTRASFRAGLLECLRHGVTTVIDHHSSPEFTRGSLAMLAEEAKALGIRISVAYEVTDRNGEDGFVSGVGENLAAWERFHENPLVHPMFGLHASFTLSDDSLKRVGEELKTREGLGIHIHLAEDQADEGDARQRGYTSVVERLEHFGLLNKQGLVIHGLHIRLKDVQTLKKAGMRLVHNPTSNANNRVGLLSKETIEAMQAGLGTDGMQAQMLAEAKEGTLIRSSHLAGGVSNVDYVHLLFGNNPAIATHLFHHPVGRIAPGYSADFAIYDYDTRTPLSPDNVAGHLLFGIGEPTDVLSMGEFRLRDGRFIGIDEAGIQEDARRQSKRLWDAMEKL
ncbi:MAG: amidohydrolase family protein [bacterium]